MNNLFFLIKRTLIPIRPQHQPRHPSGRPSHLLTDRPQGHIAACFDDQLVVDMPHNKAVRKGLHGIGQDVSADCLHDVLHEFRTVGFDAAPFLLGIHAHVGNTLAAELILANARLCIWTFDSKGELLITIMSSLAQEESRSISENVTWGHRKRMADGKVAVAYSRFIGYDKGEDGSMVINEEEMIHEFDEALWGSLVEKVTVYSKDKIVFTMTSGMEIEV